MERQLLIFLHSTLSRDTTDNEHVPNSLPASTSVLSQGVSVNELSLALKLIIVVQQRMSWTKDQSEALLKWIHVKCERRPLPGYSSEECRQHLKDIYGFAIDRTKIDHAIVAFYLINSPPAWTPEKTKALFDYSNLEGGGFCETDMDQPNAEVNHYYSVLSYAFLQWGKSIRAGISVVVKAYYARKPKKLKQD